ncbi:MAG: nucleoside-triphosphatase, partial [Bacteroidota bacterium]|nr:nucleoside-triphosphatase [Bacteroidota bacterium]
LRYKRALRQLSKPGFWIFFIVITLLTAFAFTAAKSGENLLIKGLLTGFQMNFRAAVVVVGFSVIGTELYNPAVRDYFVRTSFRNLPLALELSAESLPAFIANIPDFKSLVRNPVSIFYQVLSQADSRLSEIKSRKAARGRIFIVSGAVGEGKTTFLKKMIEVFRNNNIKAGGILAERIMSGTLTTGYDLVNIETGEKAAFLRQDEKCNTEKIGKFCISREGLDFGIKVIDSLSFPDYRVAVIDEIGMLEISGKGWAGSLSGLLREGVQNLVISVRDSNVEKVITKWDLQTATVINIGEISNDEAVNAILNGIS